MMKKPSRLLAGIVLPMCVLITGCGTTSQISQGNGGPLTVYLKPAASDSASAGTAMKEPARESKSVWHQILWYVPDRALDLVDIFRLRARVGPGLAGNIRVTNLANVYGGRYHAVFLGLPGPRMGDELRSPAGLEQERGLLFMGVDATDDLSHEPGYSPTECVLGTQLLCVGFELGFDPVEFGDFLCGFVLIDPRRDDK